MTTSLYDLSVSSYLQCLGGVAGFLDKGRAHCEAHGIDLGEIVETRLYEDMLPFRFQVLCVAHHSLGALRGLQEGRCGVPEMLDLDYAGLQRHVAEARDALQKVAREDVDALAGKGVVFAIGELELPFTNEDFVLSFSLPNLHFHATTAYDILRSKGVPLGKRDYLGQLRLNG